MTRRTTIVLVIATCATWFAACTGNKLATVACLGVTVGVLLAGVRNLGNIPESG